MNSPSLTKFFIQKQLNVNTPSSYGTPIVGAFLKGNLQIAKILRENGADLVEIGSDLPPLIHLCID